MPDTQSAFDTHDVCLKLTICVCPTKEGCFFFLKKKVMGICECFRVIFNIVC